MSTSFFSLCGGTGSGIFIDAAYLMREVAAENNFDVNINAYAVMPSIYMMVSNSPIGNERILSNAYAALRELDYVMSASMEHTIKLPWTDRETDREPFDSVTLVDNKNEAGIEFKATKDLAEMISTELLLKLKHVGNVMCIISDHVFHDRIIRAFDVENKHAWVSAIGVGALVFDALRMAEVYRLKAQNVLINKALRYSQDVDLIANDWIDSVRIRENNGQNQLIDALYDMSAISRMHLTPNDFSRQNVKGDVNDFANQYFEADWQIDKAWRSKVDAMYENVIKHLERKENELGAISIGLLYDFLTELQYMIRDIFVKKMNDEQVDLGIEKSEAKEKFDFSVDELDNYMRKFFRSSSRVSICIQDVIYAAYQYIRVEIEYRRRSYALLFYAQLLGYLETRMQHVQNVKKTLLAILSDNDMAIKAIQKMGSNHGRNTFIDLSEAPIQNMEVNEEDVDLAEWVQLLPDHTIGDIDKEKLQAAFGEYTSHLPKYVAYREITIDDAINRLSVDEMGEMMNRLINESQTFLRMNDRGCRTNNGELVGEEEVIFMVVPDAQTCRLTKDEAYRIIFPNPNVYVVNTGLADRIVVYRQKRPVPVFAIESLDKMKSYADRVISRVSPYIDENWYNAMEEECFSLLPKSLELSRNEPSSFLGEDSQTYV